jgi:hypothetical protein
MKPESMTDRVSISLPMVQKLLDYLAQKPFGEVAGLIAALQKDVADGIPKDTNSAKANGQKDAKKVGADGGVAPSARAD